MTGNRAYVVIGAFLVGVVIVATIGVLIFGSGQVFAQQRRAVVFFDQSVLGLSEGGRVLFRGVKIGTVQEVELRVAPGADNARIAVIISMPDKAIEVGGDARPTELSVTELVERGLRAQLVVYSYVTSELAVNLSFKPQTSISYAVEPGKLDLPQIPSIRSQLAKLKNKIIELPWRQTIERVNTTMKSMIELARELDRTVGTLAPQLSQTAESTQKTLKKVRELIKANNELLQSTIQQVQVMAKSATELTNSAEQNLEARSGQLQKVMASVQDTSEQLEELLSNLNTLAAPGKRPRHDIESILRDLAATAANLREFTKVLERNPQALLFGKSE